MESEFDSPSIYELYNSAKKLLLLHNRVENRQLRKDNVKSQRNHVKHNESVDVLDLLSPLSIEDGKRSGNNGHQFSILDITPASMNEYSPTFPSASSGASGFNTKPNQKVKKEPTTMISPVQINNTGSTPIEAPSPSSKWNNKKSKATPKSNLTSSLSMQKSQNQQTFSQPSPSRQSFQTPSQHLSPESPILCHNCNTLKTPLWRKDPEGNTLCNACGLFQKLHGTTRPLSLKTDIIKKRTPRRSCGGSTTSGKLSRSLPVQNEYIKPKYTGLNPELVSDNNDSYGSSTSSVSGSTSGGSSKPRNVLILPKPSNGNGGSGAAGTAATVASSTPPPSFSPGNGIYDLKSIPIPSRRISSRTPSIPNSPAESPFTGSTPGEYNQSFKRKKSDVNLGKKMSSSVNQYLSFSMSNSFSRKNSINSLPKRNSINNPNSVGQRFPINYNNTSYFDNRPNNNNINNNNNNNINNGQLQSTPIDESPSSFTSQSSLNSNNLNTRYSNNSFINDQNQSPINVSNLLPTTGKSYDMNNDIPNGLIPKDLDWLKFDI